MKTTTNPTPAWLANRPTWAKAVIVAEYEEDDSDLMTDYHNSRTTRTVLLAWSKHTRQLFPEMRKAAENSMDTVHLACLCESNEHRENYSMGKGTYLTAINGCEDGWVVRKYTLDEWPISKLTDAGIEANDA